MLIYVISILGTNAPFLCLCSLQTLMSSVVYNMWTLMRLSPAAHASVQPSQVALANLVRSMHVPSLTDIDILADPGAIDDIMEALQLIKVGCIGRIRSVSPDLKCQHMLQLCI